jgi:hypothetical protein
LNLWRDQAANLISGFSDMPAALPILPKPLKKRLGFGVDDSAADAGKKALCVNAWREQRIL